MRIAINGRFLGARATGVQRFAGEVCRRLMHRAEVRLFRPSGDVVGRIRGHLWEQCALPWLAHGHDVVLNPANALPLGGGPHVLVLHDVLPFTHPHFFTRRYGFWHRRVLARAARRSARIVTVSEWSRGEIVRELRVAPERVVVAPQGLAPFDSPAPGSAIRELLQRYGLPDRFVLGVGAGDPRKGGPFLLELARRWHAVDPGAPALVLVGSRSAAVHPKPLAGAGPDGPAIYRLNHVDDDELRALYTAASVFLFPSAAEGLGRPPLEALGCGTPAVVADYAAASEAVGDAAPILPLDVEAWIDAAAALDLPGPERKRRLAAARAAAGRWTWDAAAETVLLACHAAVHPASAADLAAS